MNIRLIKNIAKPVYFLKLKLAAKLNKSFFITKATFISWKMDFHKRSN